MWIIPFGRYIALVFKESQMEENVRTTIYSNIMNTAYEVIVRFSVYNNKFFFLPYKLRSDDFSTVFRQIEYSPWDNKGLWLEHRTRSPVLFFSESSRSRKDMIYGSTYFRVFNEHVVDWYMTLFRTIQIH